MKKFIYVFFVAILATVSFTSCSDDTDEMSDSELYSAILGLENYQGQMEDGTKIFLNLDSNGTISTYKLTLGEGVTALDLSEGTWSVYEGKVIAIDNDGVSSYNVLISNEGKTLTLEDESLGKIELKK